MTNKMIPLDAAIEAVVRAVEDYRRVVSPQHEHPNHGVGGVSRLPTHDEIVERLRDLAEEK
jgi:hypothetical protein